MDAYEWERVNDFWSAKSEYFLQILQYENPAVTMRNRLVIWTEQSVGVGYISSNYVSFSARVAFRHLLTFS